jgi:hypothetical protein
MDRASLQGTTALPEIPGTTAPQPTADQYIYPQNYAVNSLVNYPGFVPRLDPTAQAVQTIGLLMIGVSPPCKLFALRLTSGTHSAFINRF